VSRQCLWGATSAAAGALVANISPDTAKAASANLPTVFLQRYSWFLQGGRRVPSWGRRKRLGPADGPGVRDHDQLHAIRQRAKGLKVSQGGRSSTEVEEVDNKER
jgi:hypothetical protein